MSLTKKYCLPILVFLILCSQDAQSQNYIFAQLTGSNVNTNGWIFSGAAKKQNILFNDQSEILLCDNANFRSGALFYEQPINLSICSKWKAAFDFRINDGSKADGFAFCFLDVPPVGFQNGAGLGIPSTANGLKICFDTYNNCVANNTNFEMPKLELRWGSGYNECNTAQPTQINSNGLLDSIRSYHYQRALVEYNQGLITVSINGQQIISGNQVFNFTGYLGFTASTGGQTDNHSIKNVVIYTEMPPSIANATGNFSICANQISQIGTNANPNYTYTWTPSLGLSDTSISNPNLSAINPTDSILQKKYFVKTAFSNNPGCYSTDSVITNIYPAPKVDFGTPDICLKDAIANFTNLSSSRDNSSLPFQYTWNFDDAQHSTILNSNTSTLINPSHIYSLAQTYQVTLIANSAKGCVDSLSKSFTVNGDIPIPKLVQMSNLLNCSGDSIFIVDQSSVNIGKITKTEIIWDINQSPAITQIEHSPIPNQSYGHLYPVFSDLPNKNVSIRLTAYSGHSCVASYDTTLSLLANPEAIFGSIPESCDNDVPLLLTQGSLLNPMNGKGHYTGIGTDPNGYFYPSITKHGNYPLTYHFIADNGCSDTAVQTIIVKDAPIVDAGNDLIILEGLSANMKASAFGNSLNYKWSPAIYLNADTILNPLVTPLQNTLYKLTITSLVNTCEAVDSVFVKILFDPKIPNAFSPNGDGINDTWLIENIADYPDCSLQVFSRAGQIVFQSYGYQQPWDGRFQGKSLPIGTYYYLIRFTKSVRAPFSGSVTIVK